MSIEEVKARREYAITHIKSFPSSDWAHRVIILCDEIERLREVLEFIGKDVRCCSLDIATETARKALE